MGLFDAPAPLFAWLDLQMGEWVPAVFRLVIWGAVFGAISMLLYRGLSAQDRIEQDKRELKAARDALNAFDGEMDEAWPLMRRVLRLSLRQVGRVGWPAIVASLPLVFVLCWAGSSFSHVYPPPGAMPRIAIQPAGLKAQWVPPTPGGQPAMPRIVVADDNGRRLAVISMKAPVPVIAKRQWWNAFIGNPAGYLPDGAAIQRIEVPLPRIEYLSFGPAWIRGWEWLFFGSLLVVSLMLKVALRIV